jgi:hypothetical protein
VEQGGEAADDEAEQQQQQQRTAGVVAKRVRKSTQQLAQQQQQQQQLVCVRDKWRGRDCYLVTDGSSIEQQQQEAAAAAADDAPQREYLYTAWRADTQTWHAVVTIPAAVRRLQYAAGSSSSSSANIKVGSLYISAAAAATAADLAQLALLGVYNGMRLNFPLSSYSEDQRRARSGAELLQYLQQLRLRVPGFDAAAGVRRSDRGAKGSRGDIGPLARWRAARAHQRRCGLCTGCLAGRSCVVAAWRRQQQQVRVRIISKRLYAVVYILLFQNKETVQLCCSGVWLMLDCCTMLCHEPLLLCCYCRLPHPRQQQLQQVVLPAPFRGAGQQRQQQQLLLLPMQSLQQQAVHWLMKLSILILHCKRSIGGCWPCNSQITCA